MKLTIEIDCNNDAFQDGELFAEVHKIIREAMVSFERNYNEYPDMKGLLFPLDDHNGNRVGMFDDQNGIFFEFDGQQLYAVRRSSTYQLSGFVSANVANTTVNGITTTVQQPNSRLNLQLVIILLLKVCRIVSLRFCLISNFQFHRHIVVKCLLHKQL